MMYTVLFPSGKTLVFGILALAETYVLAYGGVLIGAPVDFNVVPMYNQCIELNGERKWQ